MSVTTVRPAAVDERLIESATALRERARSLRVQADSLTPPLASAYRRRASELELHAWLDELSSGLPYDEIPSAA